MSAPHEPTLRQLKAVIALLLVENDSLREMAGIKTLGLGSREYCEQEIDRGDSMNLVAAAKGPQVTICIDT